MKKLSQDAVTALGSMIIDGGNRTAVIASKLDRRLYLEVNAALEAIGGKWNRKLQAHAFEENPEDALDQIVLTGEFTNAKQDFGFFETPAQIADQLVKLAGVAAGSRVLEPSAGRGRLVAAILRAHPTTKIHANEIQPRLVETLNGTFGKQALVTSGDFLTAPIPPAKLDYAVMNPPFARQQDIDHVTRALMLLRPGGKLAAIMSAGVKFRDNNKTRRFRELLADCRPRGLASNVIDLPDNAFAESGTNVKTVMVLLEAA